MITKNGYAFAFLGLCLALCGTETFAAVGRTAGQFQVSASGSAQYSIPIWAPPGPRGVQPSISLLYDSQSSIGPLGVGWSLVGLGAITRCNLTYAQDTTPAPVALVTTDGYCLNGNRLRLTAGTYGTAGSTYQTEIADFSLVTANGTAGNGPQYFTVQARNGLTYYYGYTDGNGNGANSEVLANGTSTALTWLLSKVTDRAGNNYVVNYTIQTGTAVPSTILWTPTSAGSASYSYTMQFNYPTSNPPQSSSNQYVAGTLVSNPALLASIEILSGGAVAKDYFLGYQTSPITGREELTSVKECADSAQSNCLQPTSVSYEGGSPGLSSTPNTALSSSGSGLSARYDLNGDGYPDIVYTTSGGTTYVTFGSASGYGAPVNIGTVAQLVGNLTGGTQDGFLVQKSGVWWYYTWNGSSFTGTSTGLAVDTATQWQLADVDGDGKPDLVGLYVVTVVKNGLQHTTTSVKFYLNNSSGSTPSFSSTLNAGPIVNNGAELFTPDSQYGQLRRFDFNGDGRDDLVIVYGVPGNPATIYTDELISTGTGFTVVQASIQSGTTYTPVYFTNWNDDNCTDLVAGNTLAVSGCNGTVPQTYPISGTLLGAMDWDGDGRTDLIVANGSTLGVYLSQATGVPTLTGTTIPYASNCQYVWMDANGDGRDDLGCWSQTGSGGLTYYLHNGNSDFATSFVDGYGNSASPTYVSIAQSNYTQYSDATFPDQNYIGPLYVVSQAVFSDPSNMPSGTYTQNYSYAGAFMNLQGRGFEGFYLMTKTDSRTPLTETDYFKRAFPYTGMMNQKVIKNGSSSVSQWTGNPTVTDLDTTPNNQRYFPYFYYAFSYRWELGGTENTDLITTTQTNYTYDSYGNATTVAAVVTDNDPNSPYNGNTWSSTTTATIAPQTSTWCLNLPTETQVTNSSTAAGGTAITRTVSYTPDYTNCRESGQVVEPSSSAYKVTTGYGFDAFGNVNSQTITGIGMAARTSSMYWGTTGQFPTSAKNALLQTSTFSFDPNWGKLLSATDPNGVATSWQYDAFGRKDKELRSDGTSTTWAYNSCATAGCVNSNNVMTVVQTNVNIDSTTLNIQNTYLDTIDRTLVTSRQMLNGVYDRNEVQYDNLGRIHQQLAPCTFTGCATYWTVNSYDALNRLTQTQRPISATNSNLQYTNIAYAGRTTTVTDAQGKTKTTIAQVTGSLGRTQDNNGYYVNFTPDAFGALLSVTDSASNTLRTMTYAYGLAAYPVTLSDTDLGSRTYTVDALGEQTGYSDGKGQNFSQTYDALSRPLVRIDNTAAPDLTTTYTWGTSASSYNIGKLASVSSAGADGTYSETYTYDSHGRRTSSSIVIPGAGTNVFNYGYSAVTGLFETETFPASYPSTYRLVAWHGYAYGIPYSIQDTNSSGTRWWYNAAMNPRGQVTAETSADSTTDITLHLSRSYDAVTGWVNWIHAGAGSGSATGLQNEAYTYDYMGNLTQRQNNNLGLTENFYYDNLYRLYYSTLTNSSGTSTNLQMCYDNTGGACAENVPGVGNITSRSDVAGGAAWTYDSTHKHQVTEAGSASFTYSYDANGNAASRNGATIGWTSYNYPSSVATSTESASFDYGPNRQRWRMVYSGPTGSGITYYATPEFEAVSTPGVGTDYRHYLYAMGRPIVVISRTTTGAVNVHSLLTDHQGSISSIITDSTGANLVSESFTPYGNRREASTWSGAPTSSELTTMNGVTREGYTFQTVLGSMGLNHMNGRVEDAVTGRFLSPDPHTSDPANTQSYNRYSYVNNNPLSYTDATGFTVGKIKPGMPCIDFCSVPNGIGHWRPSLQQSAFGGMVAMSSATGNTGDGGLAGIQANDGTMYSIGDSDPTESIGTDAGIANTSAGTDSEAGSDGNTAADPGTAADQSQAQSQTPTGQPSGDQLQQRTVTGQGGNQTISVTPQNNFQSADSSLNEIVVQAARTGYLANVPINFKLPFPQEQLWVVYPGNQIYYLGSGYGTKKGNVGSNKVRLPPGFTDIIHTHPSWADSQPGPADWGDPFPLYGITPNGVWVIPPGATSPSWLCGPRRGLCVP